MSKIQSALETHDSNSAFAQHKQCNQCSPSIWPDMHRCFSTGQTGKLDLICSQTKHQDTSEQDTSDDVYIV